MGAYCYSSSRTAYPYLTPSSKLPDSSVAGCVSGWRELERLDELPSWVRAYLTVSRAVSRKLLTSFTKRLLFDSDQPPLPAPRPIVIRLFNLGNRPGA